MPTFEEIERYKELHASFDELMACFLAQTDRLPSTSTLADLMRWSHDKATSKPDGGPRASWLRWRSVGSYEEAYLGEYDYGDGVRFTLEHRSTCYRRGPWRLLVEVAGGPMHHEWGCFDEADQPERNYHSESAARGEAQAIADVLLRDRLTRGAIGSAP
jgi:hypothetical protein